MDWLILTHLKEVPIDWLAKARKKTVNLILAGNFHGLLYLFKNTFWDDEANDFWGWNKLNEKERTQLMGEVAEAGIPGIIKLTQARDLSELEAGFQGIDAFLGTQTGYHESKEPISYLYAFLTHLRGIRDFNARYEKALTVAETNSAVMGGELCLGPSMQGWHAKDHIRMRDDFWAVIKQLLREEISGK